MPRLRRECLLDAPPEALFAFHSRAENIRLVMPPTTRIVSIDAAPHAVQGALMEFRVRELGLLPMKWQCRWKTVQPPHLLVDEMLKGPFRKFEHHHIFEPAGQGTTRMIDDVDYELGAGIIGAVLSSTVIRVYLILMFAWRRRRMRRLVRDGRLQDSSP